jgi:heme-degrading monooxygenase HmoA
MVIVFVRTKLRSNADRAAYDALNGMMYELVQTLPGFVGAAEYASPDGESIGVIRFESLDTLAAWREHPEHVVAQRRGRAEFYEAYTIEVCQVVRAYDQATSARQ